MKDTIEYIDILDSISDSGILMASDTAKFKVVDSLIVESNMNFDLLSYTLDSTWKNNFLIYPTSIIYFFLILISIIGILYWYIDNWSFFSLKKNIKFLTIILCFLGFSILNYVFIRILNVINLPNVNFLYFSTSDLIDLLTNIFQYLFFLIIPIILIKQIIFFVSKLSLPEFTYMLMFIYGISLTPQIFMEKTINTILIKKIPEKYLSEKYKLKNNILYKGNNENRYLIIQNALYRFDYENSKYIIGDIENLQNNPDDWPNFQIDKDDPGKLRSLEKLATMHYLNNMIYRRFDNYLFNYKTSDYINGFMFLVFIFLILYYLLTYHFRLIWWKAKYHHWLTISKALDLYSYRNSDIRQYSKWVDDNVSHDSELNVLNEVMLQLDQIKNRTDIDDLERMVFVYSMTPSNYKNIFHKIGEKVEEILEYFS